MGRILWVVVFAFVATNAHASGFGGYVGYAHTTGTVEQEAGGPDLDHENNLVDFGFVFDTNLARDRTFNYRLNLGLQIGEREYSVSGSPAKLKEKTAGFSVNNSFGFGIVRTETMRVWLGPSIRIGLDGCTNCSGYDSLFVSAGAGGNVGVNFNIGERLTISPSFGYQYMYGANVWDDDFETSSVEGGQHHVSFLVNVLFRRSGDRFSFPQADN